MPAIALAFYLVFVMGLTVGVRVAIQLRRTGSTGIHRFRGEPGSLEWFASAIFIGNFMLVPLIVLLTLIGALEPIGALNTPAVNFAGLALASAAVLFVFVAQMAMGSSWRVGMVAEGRTELVTTGIFGIVRNPIYAGALPTVLGIALMAPTVPIFLDLVIVLTSIELPVRYVEEPHLLRLHGSAYRQYASRVGRFFPGVGLMSPPVAGAAASEPSQAA
jgi:protein-S-isoprenylcysteine O-methyltransferase Ste14